MSSLRKHIKAQFEGVEPVEFDTKYKRVRLMLPDAISDKDLDKVEKGVAEWLRSQLEQVFSLNCDERSNEIQRNEVIHSLLSSLCVDETEVK